MNLDPGDNSRGSLLPLERVPMQVEVIKELEPDAPELVIPWESKKRSGIRFIALKRYCAKIEALPECKSYCELASFLRGGKQSGSAFLTAK
jgi:hypothetical protein